MLGVLTYDHPHRKTSDLLTRLKALGHDNVAVFGLPWMERKHPAPPLYPHRPTNGGVHPQALCAGLGYPYRTQVRTVGECSPADFVKQCERTLIGGCGILPPEVVAAGEIVNSHPAMLPFVRGLDALKWAIYDGLPIGVTVHIIEEEADCGHVIEQVTVPVEPLDTFGHLAWRMWDTEIELLAQHALDPPGPRTVAAEVPVRKRMKHAEEVVMIARFERRRIG